MALTPRIAAKPGSSRFLRVRYADSFMLDHLKQDVSKVNNKTFMAGAAIVSDTYAMERIHRKPKPQWASRLTTAFGAAGYAVECTADREKLTETFGVHQMTIKSWCDGRTEPGFDKLVKVQNLTVFSLDWVLCVPGAKPHSSDK